MDRALLLRKKKSFIPYLNQEFDIELSVNGQNLEKGVIMIGFINKGNGKISVDYDKGTILFYKNIFLNLNKKFMT